jgi:hypothetical protein
LRELGKFTLDFASAGLFLRREIGTLLSKVGECFVDVALLGSREFAHGGTFAEGF